MSEQNSRVAISELLKTGKPSQIISSPIVGDRFQELYKTIHGIRNKDQAAAFYQAEQFHFLKLINDNPKIAACSKLSLYGIFMDVAVNGLSFDPSMKHLYVLPYNVNVGTRDNAKWEARAQLQISGYGELLLRMKQGQIKYADNPVIVYQGDEFRYGSKDGKVILDHIASIPRKSSNIVACYLKITRFDDTVDYKVLTAEEVAEMRKQSKDPNGSAWTNNYAGMVMAKTIKHAFKNYPKLRVGDFSTAESESDEAPSIDYGLDMQLEAPVVAPVQQPITPHEEVNEPAQAAPTQPEPAVNNFATAAEQKTVVFNSEEAF